MSEQLTSDENYVAKHPTSHKKGSLERGLWIGIVVALVLVGVSFFGMLYYLNHNSNANSKGSGASPTSQTSGTDNGTSHGTCPAVKSGPCSSDTRD